MAICSEKANSIKKHMVCPLILITLILLLLFIPQTSIGRQSDAPVLKKLADNAKIRNPDRLLKKFWEGLPQTRVIVRLQDSDKSAEKGIDMGSKKNNKLSDLSFRQKRRIEISRKVGDYLKKFAKNEVNSKAGFEYMFGFGAEVTISGLEKLAEDPEVVFIEEDELVEAHLKQGITLMNASGVRSNYSGAGVSIAICDTGIDYNHVRLGGGGFPNGKVIGGYDTGEEDNDPMDANGHGTACAGIAAGDLGTNADYIGGVANGSKLYALKITNTPSGSSAWTSDIIQAWEWTITHQFDDPANPIMIISTSFGGGRYQSSCDNLQSSFATAADNANSAGISIFASSGNEGYCDALGSPACLSDVISVGAFYDASFGMYFPCVDSLSCVTKTADGSCSSGYYAHDSTASYQVASYSNTAPLLTLLAPSNKAYTTDISGTGGYSTSNYHSSFGGTSAASPYAAGAGAILQNASKVTSGVFLSAKALKDALTDSGEPTSDPKSPSLSKPRINLQAAVDALDSDADGIVNNADNCPGVSNPDQLDFDKNINGFECDAGEQNMLANYRSQAGDVNDAPHNSTYGITCGTCHTYSLWFNASPVKEGDPDFIPRVDSICSPCHGFGQAYSHMKGHNKGNTGTGGGSLITKDWKQSCVDCHDPHIQPQLLEYYPADQNELYLVVGTISDNATFTIDETSNTTTFGYENHVVNNNDFTLQNTWQQKNDTLPGNGLIAVINPDNRANSYRVLSADGTNIEVKGFVDPGMAGSQFALVYGQNIKTSIGGQPIKFFSPYGDYDRQPGLCNTCHTDNNIKFHDKGGLKPPHYPGQNCTTSVCHSVTEGFKPPAL